MRSRRLGVPVALGACVEREPERADRVRLPQPEKRHRHREVLVDPRELHRHREACCHRPAESARAAAAPSASLIALPASMPRSCASFRAGAERGAEREEERARLLPVGEVGGVDDLLRRHTAVEVEQVDRAPGRGVEEHVFAARHRLREVGQVGDARVGDDQRRVRARLDESGEARRDRRQAAAAVDQDRHPALLREREDGREALVGRVESLRPRVELDPARAGVEAACRLLDRALVQVEPNEGDQAAAGARGERERPVVGGAEGGVAVGLVEAEHERARDSVRGHHPLARVVVADHAVYVVSQVQVRVEDVGARRDQALQLLVVRRAQLERTLQRGRHR